MMAFPRIFSLWIAAMVLAGSAAPAQFNRPAGQCVNGRCYRNPELSRDADLDRFQNSVDDEFPEDPFSAPSAREFRRDPFRRPDREEFLKGDRRSRPAGLSGRPENQERRYRVPLDRTDERELDPFVPAPAPRGRVDDEAAAIDALITARYQNPVNVRAVKGMSASQALNLYVEVSQRIDARHMQPSTYDLRMRRALRNLTIALDNPVFSEAMGVDTGSFRTDSFRNLLGDLAESMRIGGFEDSRNFLVSVMRQAESVPGLTPSAVAFEFASASLDTLDKFSGLEPSETTAGRGTQSESDVRSASLEEEIVGIGVEVKVHDRGLVVAKALRGGPALEAGLQSGDVIVAITGRRLEGMPMASSVDLMKGPAGSEMSLRVSRAGRGERDFAVTRRRVRVWTVNDVRMLPGTDVAYLSLSRFAQNSTAELDQALTELHHQGMKSLVIDLRGNPGGLLTTCVEISDRFLPCGTIVSTKGRLDSDNMHEQATRSRTWSTPIVVLVDGDSASASEIFAAAIQENDRGIVVGTRTYGKGTVQTHFPLNAIAGNLRLTTASFYSPNGRPMTGEGVTPDVERTDADGVENGDEVLEEAVEIARSPRLKEMAQAAGKCRTGAISRTRSSSLDQIIDPGAATISIR